MALKLLFCALIFFFIMLTFISREDVISLHNCVLHAFEIILILSAFLLVSSNPKISSFSLSVKYLYARNIINCMSFLGLDRISACIFTLSVFLSLFFLAFVWDNLNLKDTPFQS